MKKILYTSAVAALLLSSASCSNDFIDVNHNDNEVYNSELSPKERLAAAETTLHATHATTLNQFGNLMMNAWTGNIYQYTAPFDDEMKMNVNSTFYNEIWDNYYIGIGNLQRIIDTPNANAVYPGYVAAAKIMKAYYMQTIVDLYNDVPYSKAFNFQGNVTPKYDKGKDIYQALLKELDEALVLFNTTTPPTILASSDVMFKGVTDDWIKFGNTVKLKMLVRLSGTTDSSVTAYRDSAMNTWPTLSKGFITTSAIINPGYSSAATAQQNPLYRNFGLVDISNQLNANYRLVLASANIVDHMMGRASLTSGVIDSRIQNMFRANVWAVLEGAQITSGFTGYYGLQQGLTSNSNNKGGDYAGLGAKQFLITNSSDGSKQDGIVMSLAEAELLQSEAAVLYPAKFSDGQTHFEAGIKASFTFYGLSDASANTYITNSNTKANVGWGASTNKIAAIQYQRWIALTNINPTETFISYTKTGFPDTPMPVGATTATRPVRLIYPQSEYVANSANVPNMIKIDAFSKTNQYAPFWLK
ncbi:SusD/RagB family nutrient-binding outer membrane lipoprotein [Chryseobacterium sp.]|uniref:SusD/RagB family nutrient-binding outer membrane lipoprotein n=1 Tax=Chryseobacterium sp. TaxID=1871047 RepID=UPI001B2A91B8|nr:SusD/RagB family nutrient-binding outer membrane lipoprotein [Chryseobacterium sp.]MBO9692929.1 SusD/RagB family nutrient-binding outer membrane lipoprotein [Chryseobacterium sp.]